MENNDNNYNNYNNDIIIDMTNAPPPTSPTRPTSTSTSTNTNTNTNTNTYSNNIYGLQQDVDIPLYDTDNSNNSNNGINILQSVCNFLKKYLPNSITNEAEQYA